MSVNIVNEKNLYQNCQIHKRHCDKITVQPRLEVKSLQIFKSRKIHIGDILSPMNQDCFIIKRNLERKTLLLRLVLGAHLVVYLLYFESTTMISFDNIYK